MADGGTKPDLTPVKYDEAQDVGDGFATAEWMLLQALAEVGALPAKIDAAARAGNMDGLQVRACEELYRARSLMLVSGKIAEALQELGIGHCDVIGRAERAGIALPAPRILAQRVEPVKQKTGGR